MTSYTVITQIFSDEVMKYISYIEIVVGVGLGLGPAIGSIVYAQVQYAWTMYFFGVLNLGGLISCVFLIPSKLNKSASDEQQAEIDAENDDFDVDDDTDKKKLTWCKIM